MTRGGIYITCLHLVKLNAYSWPGYEYSLDLQPVYAIVNTPFREEQYRQMWRECEKLVRCHANNSPNHQRVLECLLNCKGPSDPASPPKASEDATKGVVAGKTGEGGVKEEKPALSQFEQSMQTYER